MYIVPVEFLLNDNNLLFLTKKIYKRSNLTSGKIILSQKGKYYDFC